MKQEMNNEMDVLLRRLGRQKDSSATGNGDHLDADELNSYAENALPVTARARYAEHLAECASCRALVVQLSSAVGVVSAAETTKTSAPSALRKFLARVFSPMVLRYAVPALGLIVVAAIGVVVLRNQRRPSEVAQVQTQQSQPAAVSATDAPVVNYAYSGESAHPEAGKVQQSPTSRGVATDAAAQPSPTAVNKIQNAPAARPETVEPNAAAPAPAAPTEPVQTEERQARAVEQPKRENERTVTVKPDDAAKKSADFIVTDDRKTAESQASRGRAEKNKSIAAAPAVGGLAKARRGAADDANKESDKDAGETRSVAGHQFHKQRGIWIDTAYDSRETMTLTRGSESFRTVVADEPAIKTIADQLDGEIIVLWKSRAYRIR